MSLLVVGEELVEHGRRDPAELAALFAAVEHGHFQVTLGQRLVLCHHEGPNSQLDRAREVQALLIVVLEIAPDLVGLPTHGRVVLLVLDGAVIEDVVDLVFGAVAVATSTTSTST